MIRRPLADVPGDTEAGQGESTGPRSGSIPQLRAGSLPSSEHPLCPQPCAEGTCLGCAPTTPSTWSGLLKYRSNLISPLPTALSGLLPPRSLGLAFKALALTRMSLKFSHLFIHWFLACLPPAHFKLCLLQRCCTCSVSHSAWSLWCSVDSS